MAGRAVGRRTAVRWEPVELRAAGAYDGARLLTFLGAHGVPGMESWDAADGVYRRTLGSGGGSGSGSGLGLDGAGWAVAELRAVPGGVAGRVGLPPGADPGAVTPRVLAALGHLLALDRDEAPAEQALAADPLLGPLVAARPGLRLPGSTDPTQELVRTVIGQQVSVAGARTVTGRVVAVLGAALPEPVAAQTGLTRLWPTPQALADAPAEALPMPLARARAVRAVAAAVADGRLRWDEPDAVALRVALLALPGVGPWTADYTLVRALRHPDVFLPGDLAIRRQLAALGGPEDPAGAAALAQRWSPFRSLALAHLWAAYLGH